MSTLYACWCCIFVEYKVSTDGAFVHFINRITTLQRNAENVYEIGVVFAIGEEGTEQETLQGQGIVFDAKMNRINAIALSM